MLTVIQRLFGVPIRTLSQIIAANSNADVSAQPFIAETSAEEATSAVTTNGVGTAALAVQANRSEQDLLSEGLAESVG